MIETYITKSIVYRSSAKFFTYVSPVTLIFLITFTYIFFKRNRKFEKLTKQIEKIPGPPKLPIVGHLAYVQVDHSEILDRFSSLLGAWGRHGITRVWNLSTPVIFLNKPATVEPIMSSSKQIDKSPDYDFLHPWLGTGLLTSRGQKWHSRRKILTPAFHFKILDDFLDIFNEQSLILVDRLKQEVNNDGFNIFPYVTLCTLDVICETAMGIKVNAQENSDSSYVKAVYEIGSIVLNRQSKILLQSDFLFRFTSEYKRHQNAIKILHGVSYKVIKERKEEIAKKNQMKEFLNNNNNNNNLDQINNNINTAEEGIGEKKRLAFLDLLIEASKDGTVLSIDDIREEVDTFMFEGHDTTSAAISWTLFLIGSDKAIQKRIQEELNSVFGDDKDRAATMKELAELKYLECCIKEALRLFPSVPMMGRQLVEDVQIGNYLVPKGTTAMVCTYMLHRDTETYKNPEVYNPDRFLPENTKGRHPYAYIPFSAGPRNCIGQKFAILEEKIILSTIFRRFNVEAVDRRENLTICAEQILRPKDGIRVKLTERV